MRTPFELQVVTPDGVGFSETVMSVRLPAVSGTLGILARHAPLVSPLIPGELWVRDENQGETSYAIGEGFVDVADNVCTVLTDFSLSAADIDVDRAARSAERARERLASPKAGYDVIRAKASLLRAVARVQVAKRHG